MNQLYRDRSQTRLTNWFSPVTTGTLPPPTGDVPLRGLQQIVTWELNGYRIWRKQLLRIRKKQRRNMRSWHERHQRAVFVARWLPSAEERELRQAEVELALENDR